MKNRWNRHVVSNSYISDNGNQVPILILDLKLSYGLLLFMALGTKDHVLGAK